MDRVLTAADSLLTVQPDSALHYLEVHARLKDEASRSQRMRYELLRATAQNKVYVDFTTDSVMKQVADYYDHHGTANQQLQAHYLLGCVYRDLGDAPRAIECFLDAVEKADTTVEECDYRTMGHVYAQMAESYHKQLLLTNEIHARRRAHYYTFICGDTLSAIYDYRLLASPYILLNEIDSAENILKEVIDSYLLMGNTQQALQTSTMLMHIYEKQPSRQQELGDLINKYDEDCCLFDSLHDLPPSKRQYFYYKAKYLENCQQYDSAEYYYRKIYRTGMSHVQKDPMYRGLLSVFQKKHQADSIAKYAALFAEANDSSIAVKDRELTAQMTASYNYSRYQRQALDNERTAKHRLQAVVLLLAAILAVSVFTFILWRQNRNKKTALEQMERDYADARNNYETAVRRMKELKEKHKNTISAIKRDNTESHALIDMLNRQHEEERERLEQELQEAKDRVEQLDRQLKLSDYQKAVVPFLNHGVVKRVKYYAEDSLHQLSENDLNTLAGVVNDYFPDLISDIDGSPAISPLARQVCLLALLNVKPGDIVHLLGISSSQVSNLRRELNVALFNENTTRTLYQNLVRHYQVETS